MLEILQKHATHSTLASHPVDSQNVMANQEVTSEVPTIVAEQAPPESFIDNTVEKLDKDFPLSGTE